MLTDRLKRTEISVRPAPTTGSVVVHIDGDNFTSKIHLAPEVALELSKQIVEAAKKLAGQTTKPTQLDDMPAPRVPGDNA